MIWIVFFFILGAFSVCQEKANKKMPIETKDGVKALMHKIGNAMCGLMTDFG